MTKEEALQFLAQCGVDLAQTLPPAARGPLVDKIKEAVRAMKMPVEEADGRVSD